MAFVSGNDVTAHNAEGDGSKVKSSYHSFQDSNNEGKESDEDVEMLAAMPDRFSLSEHVSDNSPAWS